MAERRGRARRMASPGKRQPVDREAREAGRRRPWLVFGPGLLVTLGAAALLLWCGRRATGPGPGFRPAPSTVPSTSGAPLGLQPAPAPDLAFVLRQTSALGLSGGQARKLARLERQFERNTIGTRADLAQASDEFALEMRERGGAGIMLPDLQERTAAVSQLSRQLAAARRFYWARAGRALTPAQRAQAEGLWSGHLRGGGPSD